MTSHFEIRGKHVLAMMLGFFLVIVIANTIFITLAVRSFPGEQEKKSYVQGLRFNDELARREAQAELGWSVSVAKARLGMTGAELTLRFTEDDRPLNALAVDAVLSRPADDHQDQNLSFAPIGDGVYVAEAPGAGAGMWNLKARAVGPEGDEFRFDTRLELK
ncbi:MAG: FixH family protein [Pseudomonadota bacterium]